MMTQPIPVDWTRIDQIGTRIVWENAAYQHFKDGPEVNPAPTTGGAAWIRLPFEPVHVDKLPELGGLYAFSYTYRCLGFLEQEIIMYVGEAENLRTRLNQYMGIANGISGGNSPATRPRTRIERIRHLFSTFQDLAMLYRTLNLTQDERRALERNLINLLDPPYNWQHRPSLRARPTIGRPGTILATSGDATPAFG